MQKRNRSDRTIIVTGGAGFIGSTFLNILVPRYSEYHFVVVDSLTAVADKKNITVLKNRNVTFVRCDIRKRAALTRVFKKYKPTDVVHFAAETHVDVSIIRPMIFVETNILGTANLLALAHAHHLRRFHHISTDEVCGALQSTDQPLTEDAPLLPNNPYSASKASAECLVRAYHKTFGLDIVITRCSNNFGPRQDRTKFIPLFVSKLLDSKQAPLYGDGLHVRDWLYVDDHVEALDLVFHKGRSGEIYNISGQEYSNKDVVNKLLMLLKRDSGLISYVTDRPGHDRRYALDSSKIKKELAWKPKTSFDEGLANTIAYIEGQRTRPRKR